MPKDNLKWEAVISEILRIENAKVGARRQLYWNAKNTPLTQEMIQIASFRHKKKFSQLETVVDGIKKKYKSLRNAHKLVKHDLNWKRFHTICNPTGSAFLSSLTALACPELTSPPGMTTTDGK